LVGLEVAHYITVALPLYTVLLSGAAHSMSPLKILSVDFLSYHSSNLLKA